MPKLTRQAIQEEAERRRERILGYMRQDPPIPLTEIMHIEGMSSRACRDIILELDNEFQLGYMQRKLRRGRDDLPHGLTQATARLRQRLGDNLYLLTERGDNSEYQGRYAVSPLIGMNNREQLRAEQRPFNHDWTLSQIERLARQLNREPREFLLSCLTG